MVFGFGPVAFSTFIGFFVGIYFGKNQSLGGLTNILGYVILVLGLLSMVKAGSVNGTPGGFLTGLGLGITFAQDF